MQNIIFSLGGSVIYPQSGIDTNFLKDFNSFMRNKIAENKNRRFFIIAGGGYTSDRYKEAAIQIVKEASREDLDWLGVRSTRLNAHLLRTIFYDIAAPRIIEHYHPLLKLNNYKLFICAAEYPGATTDWFLITLAQQLSAKKVFSLLNVRMIYNKDPKKFNDVKPIQRLTWRNYLEMIGEEWSPSPDVRQVPFDPLSAKLARQFGIDTVFLNGHDLNNFDKAISDKPFIGTTIYENNNSEDYE